MSAGPSSSPRDELGTLAMMTDTSKLAAFNAIPGRHKAYQLGIWVDHHTPAWGDRRHQVTIKRLPCGETRPITSFLDDHLKCHVGIGTHVDLLSHCEVDGVFYGGFSRAEVFAENGVKKLGLNDKITHICARAKLINMVANYGKNKCPDGYVPGGTEYTRSDIRNACFKQKLSIKPGDVILLYSGWMKIIDKPTVFNASEPGPGVDAINYLKEKGAMIIATDTWGMEVFKNGQNKYPGHVRAIKVHGMPIGEMFNLEQLVTDNVNKGTIEISLDKIKGTCQARCNPIFRA